MKAEELRIGNWFRKIDDDGDRPEQVAPEDLLAWSKGAGYGSPIPITAKWLERFGFRKHVNGSYSIDDYLITFDEDGFRLEYGEYCTQGSLIDLNHVHQLQNLYYALTGTELELKEL